MKYLRPHFAWVYQECFINTGDGEASLRLTVGSTMMRSLAFYQRGRLGSTAAITDEPAGKGFFVYSCMQTRLMAQYNGIWPISLVYMSKPLITVTTAFPNSPSTVGLSFSVLYSVLRSFFFFFRFTNWTLKNNFSIDCYVLFSSSKD